MRPVVSARVAALILLLLALSALAPAAAAQAGCGDRVIVARGDTLFAIAQRCGVTVEALLEANPQVDPRRLEIGQAVLLPGATVEAGAQAVAPVVAIYPAVARPGTPVDVIANGLPAGADVTVALVGPDALAPVVTQTITTDAGAAQAQLQAPASAPAAGPLQVTVTTTDGKMQAATMTQPTAALFPLSGPPGTEVRLIANGFAPNSDVEIGLGPSASTISPLGAVRVDDAGALSYYVLLPATTESESVVLSVRALAGSTGAVTQPFVFTDEIVEIPVGGGGVPEPGVTLSATTSQPGEVVSLSATGFPPNSAVIVGLGHENAGFTTGYAATTDAQGMLNVELQIPVFAAPGSTWLAVVMTADGGQRATSAPLQVAGIAGPQAGTLDRANIYLIAPGDAGRSGPEIGCGDSVVGVEVTFAPTVAPLRAALETLLGLDSAEYGQSGLMNALSQSDLSIEGINLVDGEAVIALSGNLRLGGVCDAPRVEAQLTETALQFPTVNRARVTINGRPLEELLSGRG